MNLSQSSLSFENGWNWVNFCSMTRRFRVTRHFETRSLNNPKMTLNTKRSNVLHTHVKTTHESLISLRFALQACRFRVTGHFETSAPNDPKMTLDTKRSNVPHMHDIVPESQIWLCVALRLAISETFKNFHFIKSLTFQNSKKQPLCGLLQGTISKRLGEKESKL